MNVNLPKKAESKIISIDQGILLNELRNQEQIIRQEIEKEIAEQKKSGTSVWDKLKSFIPNVLKEKKEIYLRILKKQLQIKEEIQRDSSLPQNEKNKIETEIRDIKSKITLIEKTKSSPQDISLLSSVLLQTELIFGVKRKQGREFLAIEQAKRVSESLLLEQTKEISIDGGESTNIEISFPQDIQKKIINFIKKPRKNSSFDAEKILTETNVVDSICEFVYSNYPNVSLKTNKKEALEEIKQIAIPQLIRKLNEFYSQYNSNKILFNAMFRLQIQTIKPLSFDSRDSEEVRADLRQIFTSFSDVSGKSLLDPVRLISKSLQSKFATTSRRIEAAINRVSRPAAYAILGFLGGPGVGASIISGFNSGVLRERRRLQEERLNSQISQILGTKKRGISDLVREKASPIVGGIIADKLKSTDEQYKEIFSSQLYNPLELLESDPSKLLALLQLEEEFKVLLIDYSKIQQSSLSAQVSELSRVYILRSSLLSSLKNKSTIPSEVAKHKVSLTQSIEKRLNLVRSFEGKLILSSAVKSAVIAGTISSIVPFVGKGVAQFVTERLGDLYEEFESLGIISDLSRISADAARSISSSIKFPEISKDSLLKLPSSGISSVIRLIENLRRFNNPILRDDLDRAETEISIAKRSIDDNLSNRDNRTGSAGFEMGRNAGVYLGSNVKDHINIQDPSDINNPTTTAPAAPAATATPAATAPAAPNSPSSQSVASEVFDKNIDQTISEDYDKIQSQIYEVVSQIKTQNNFLNTPNLSDEDKSNIEKIIEGLKEDLEELNSTKNSIFSKLHDDEKEDVLANELIEEARDSYAVSYETSIASYNAIKKNILNYDFIIYSQELNNVQNDYYTSLKAIYSNSDVSTIPTLIDNYRQNKSSLESAIDNFDCDITDDLKTLSEKGAQEFDIANFYIFQQFELFRNSYNVLEKEIEINNALIESLKTKNTDLFILFDETKTGGSHVKPNLFDLNYKINELKETIKNADESTISSLNSQISDLEAHRVTIINFRDQYYDKSGYKLLLERQEELLESRQALLHDRLVLYNIEQNLALSDKDKGKEASMLLTKSLTGEDITNLSLSENFTNADLDLLLKYIELSKLFKSKQVELIKSNINYSFDTELLEKISAFNTYNDEFDNSHFLDNSAPHYDKLKYYEFKHFKDHSFLNTHFEEVSYNRFLDVSEYHTYISTIEDDEVISYYKDSADTQLGDLGEVVEAHLEAKKNLVYKPDDIPQDLDLSTTSISQPTSSSISTIGELNLSVKTIYGGSDVVSESDTVPHWRGDTKLEITPSLGSNINLSNLKDNVNFKIAFTDSNGNYLFLDKSYVKTNDEGNIEIDFSSNEELSNLLKNNRVQISYGILDGDTFTRAETFFSSGSNNVYSFNELK